MKRARSAVTGQWVKAIVAKLDPRQTIVEEAETLAIRMRVDDRRVVVELRPLDELRPGDTIVAKLPADSELKDVRAVARELERWAHRHAPGSDYIAVAGDVSIGVDRAGDRLTDVNALVADLERQVGDRAARIPTGATHQEARAAISYSQRLEEGIVALRLALDADRGAEEPAAA